MYVTRLLMHTCEVSCSLHWPDLFSLEQLSRVFPRTSDVHPSIEEIMWSPVSVCIIKSASMWSVQPATTRVGPRKDSGNEGLYFIFRETLGPSNSFRAMSDNIGADYGKYSHKFTNCLQATWVWWSGTAYSSANLYYFLDRCEHIAIRDFGILVRNSLTSIECSKNCRIQTCFANHSLNIFICLARRSIVTEILGVGHVLRNTSIPHERLRSHTHTHTDWRAVPFRVLRCIIAPKRAFRQY